LQHNSNIRNYFITKPTKVQHNYKLHQNPLNKNPFKSSQVDPALCL